MSNYTADVWSSFEANTLTAIGKMIQKYHEVEKAQEPHLQHWKPKAKAKKQKVESKMSLLTQQREPLDLEYEDALENAKRIYDENIFRIEAEASRQKQFYESQRRTMEQKAKRIYDQKISRIDYQIASIGIEKEQVELAIPPQLLTAKKQQVSLYNSIKSKFQNLSIDRDGLSQRTLRDLERSGQLKMSDYKSMQQFLDENKPNEEDLSLVEAHSDTEKEETLADKMEKMIEESSKMRLAEQERQNDLRREQEEQSSYSNARTVYGDISELEQTKKQIPLTPPPSVYNQEDSEQEEEDEEQNKRDLEDYYRRQKSMLQNESSTVKKSQETHHKPTAAIPPPVIQQKKKSIVKRIIQEKAPGIGTYGLP
jgi:hypothetical protein